MTPVDHHEAAQARGLDSNTVETWIERGYLRALPGSAPDRHQVDPDELDRVIRQRVSDPAVLAKVPEEGEAK